MSQNEIDFSKVQLLEYKDETTHYVVLTTGKHKGRNFRGVILYSNSNDRKVGRYSKMFVKEFFKKHIGTVIITEDGK